VAGAVTVAALPAGGVVVPIRLELWHAPLATLEPESVGDLLFYALCASTSPVATKAQSVATCAGATFEFSVTRDGGPSSPVLAVYDPGVSAYRVRLAPEGANRMEYTARIAWHDQVVEDGGDVVVAPTSPVTDAQAAITRRGFGPTATAVAWSRTTVQPSFAGGAAIGTTGWAVQRNGASLVVDATTGELVELSGNATRRRVPIPVAPEAVTGIAVTDTDSAGAATRVLVASHDASGARLQLIDLQDGHVVVTRNLPSGRGSGYLITESTGSVSVVTYPGPLTHQVTVTESGVSVGPGTVERPISGGAGQRLRVRVDDDAATYCVDRSECYRLTTKDLGGLKLGELAFAGAMLDGSLLLVQKIWNDSASLYLTLQAKDGRMRAIRALPSEGDFEIPLGSRFSLSSARDQLLQLSTTPAEIRITSTPMGG
jgi:hypothetical protein